MANRNVKKATSKEKAANMQKQAYMRAAGYNVPQDGSWGPWQQSIWNSLPQDLKSMILLWQVLQKEYGIK